MKTDWPTGPKRTIETKEHARGMIGGRRARGLRKAAVVALAALITAGVGPAVSDGYGYRSASPTQDRKVIQVPINKSRIVDLRSPVTRVSVANPAIADILVVNPEQIYVVGKELGTTNMTLWDEDDRVKDMMGLEVTHDIQTLKEKMFRYLPGENVRVESSQGAIALSGEVSSATRMDAALRLAETYSAGGKVINLMQVGGAQQVMLEVRVAEISRSFVKNLDVKFKGLYDGGSVKMGLVNGGALINGTPADVGNAITPRFPVVAPGAGLISDTGIFGQFLQGNFFFNMVLDAAQNQGLARILAEPNLTTLSGQEAKFLAGGEFPIPVPQNSGGGTTITVEYKDYGVGLAFVPLVLDSGLISLNVNVSVSEITSQNAVVLRQLRRPVADQARRHLVRRGARRADHRHRRTAQRPAARRRQQVPGTRRGTNPRRTLPEPAVSKGPNGAGDLRDAPFGAVLQPRGGHPADRRLRGAKRHGILSTRPTPRA